MIPKAKGSGRNMPYDVIIERLAPFALYDLKGSAQALKDWTGITLPNAANRLTHSDTTKLCHIGPSHWFLRAPLAEEEGLEQALKPTDAPPDISIVRISDTQTFFRITGPDAAQVVSIGCPVDLFKTNFPKDAVSFTEFFQLKALILRAPDGFEIAVEQSFGNMIADYLNRATA